MKNPSEKIEKNKKIAITSRSKLFHIKNKMKGIHQKQRISAYNPLKIQNE